MSDRPGLPRSYDEDISREPDDWESPAEYAATHPVLCAHADDGGEAHWLEPGEKCGRENAP